MVLNRMSCPELGQNHQKGRSPSEHHGTRDHQKHRLHHHGSLARRHGLVHQPAGDEKQDANARILGAKDSRR